jgi:transposase-like protein
MDKTNQINENCLQCGKSPAGMTQPHHRKYCSITCSNKYRLRQKKPDVQAKLWQHKPEVFEEAVNMYWNGSGGAEIAREYEIPVGTVYSWIHDFGKQKERVDIVALPRSEQLKRKPLKERFKMAETAGEWRGILQEQAEQNERGDEDPPIYLVCGLLHGQSVNKLASVIFENLKGGPLGGNVFAFCNKCRNIITAVSWKEPLYNIVEHIRTHGTFFWPHEDLGEAVEVTKAELEHLIAHKKHNKIRGGATAKNAERP